MKDRSAGVYHTNEGGVHFWSRHKILQFRRINRRVVCRPLYRGTLFMGKVIMTWHRPAKCLESSEIQREGGNVVRVLKYRFQ